MILSQKNVNVIGTDEKERIEVQRIDPKHTRVRICRESFQSTLLHNTDNFFAPHNGIRFHTDASWTSNLREDKNFTSLNAQLPDAKLVQNTASSFEAVFLFYLEKLPSKIELAHLLGCLHYLCRKSGLS